LPEINIEAVVFDELEDVFDANPVVSATINSHNNSLRGIPFSCQQASPKLYQFHLPSHNLENHLSENPVLLQNSLLLTWINLGMLQSFSDCLSQLQVVSREQKSSKLESADFSDFEIVHPGKGISKKFSMGGADNFVNIFFAEKSFFFPVEKAEETQSIEIWSFCQSLPERLNRFIQQ
jgi:hypothetical protein